MQKGHNPKLRFGMSLEEAKTSVVSAALANPPPLPADRHSSWADALSWAIASGVGVGVARLLAIRTAAVVWEATTHEPPPEPGLEARADS